MRGLFFALSLLTISLLAFVACGGGDDDGESTPTGTLTAEDVAPELVAALGVPATLDSPPVTETFGPEGGELELADGAVLEVPEGAFEEDTAVTVTIINLDYGEDVRAMRVYGIAPESGLEVIREPLLLHMANLGLNAFLLGVDAGQGEFTYQEFAADGDLTFTISNSADASVRALHSGLVRAASDTVFFGAEFVCTALFGDSLKDPDNETALAGYFYCMLSFGLGSESCQQGARDAGLDPVEACGDPDWVFETADDRRIDLKLAGVDEDKIGPVIAAYKTCLSSERSNGNSREGALAKCESVAPIPTPASMTPTGSATATPTPETQGTDAPTTGPTAAQTAAPTGAPTAQPTPTPQLGPALTFLEGPTGFVVREYDHTEDLCAGDTCRDYDVSGRVAWSGLEGTADLQCYGTGRLEEGFRVSVDGPSGDMAFDLTVNRWQFDFDPTIRCDLLDTGGASLAAVLKQVQVQ